MTKKIGLYSPRDNIMWRNGGFFPNSFSPKKFRSRNKKVCFGPIQPPECIVVLDTERKSSVILEAYRLQVPIATLVDSSMPSESYKTIAYPVPTNDSVQFVYLFCNMITKTFLLEQKKLREFKGDVAKEETALGRKCGKLSKARSAIQLLNYLLFLMITHASDDIAEIKQHFDKLVVVKFNSKLGTAMGFGGPK